MIEIAFSSGPGPPSSPISVFPPLPCGGSCSPFIHLPNRERVKANLHSLALQSRGLSGGDILIVCLNAIHAGSRDPDPAKWVVTEELLVREIRRAKTAKARHGGPGFDGTWDTGK